MSLLGYSKGPSIVSSPIIFVRPTLVPPIRFQDIFLFLAVHGPKLISTIYSARHAFYYDVLTDVDTVGTRVFVAVRQYLDSVGRLRPVETNAVF